MRLGRMAVAATLAAALALVIAGGATAAEPNPDGAYAVFRGSGVRGAVILHYTGTTTVNAGVMGLTTSQEYFVIGRSIGCNGTPANSNRVFKAVGTTDVDGALSLRATVSIGHNVVSFWLGSNDALDAAICAPGQNYLGNLQDADDYNGDGLLGLKAGASEVLLESVVQRSSAGTRVNVFLHNLVPGHDYVVRYVTGRCSRAAGKAYATITLDNVVGSVFTSRAVAMGQEKLDGLRSIRVRDTTTGKSWACVPGIIMANTEGDFH